MEAKSLEIQITTDEWKDTIKAGKELQKIINSCKVEGDNHVITLVSDLKTGRSYYGFNDRLRRQLRHLEEFRIRYNLLQNIPNQLQKWVPKRKVQESKRSRLENPKLPNEERRVLKRSPKTCAEYEAYNKFYYNRTDAKPTESRAVSVKYKYGKYTAVRRCENCRIYAKAMGHAPTDGIHGLRIPLHESTSYSKVGYSSGRVPGNPSRTCREYIPVSGRPVSLNSVSNSRNDAVNTTIRMSGNSVCTSREKENKIACCAIL